MKWFTVASKQRVLRRTLLRHLAVNQFVTSASRQKTWLRSRKKMAAFSVFDALNPNQAKLRTKYLLWQISAVFVDLYTKVREKS